MQEPFGFEVWIVHRLSYHELKFHLLLEEWVQHDRALVVNTQ